MLKCVKVIFKFNLDFKLQKKNFHKILKMAPVEIKYTQVILKT